MPFYDSSIASTSYIFHSVMTNYLSVLSETEQTKGVAAQAYYCPDTTHGDRHVSLMSWKERFVS